MVVMTHPSARRRKLTVMSAASSSAAAVAAAAMIVLVTAGAIICVSVVQAFQPPMLSVPSLKPAVARRKHSTFVLHSTRKRRTETSPPSNLNQGDDLDHVHDVDDDELLLQTVTEAQLLDLCEQLHLDLGEGVVGGSSSSSSSSSNNNKAELLRRLRQYADEQRHAEELRRRERDECVERGSRDDASKERYETVESSADYAGSNFLDDDDDFYIALPVLSDDARASSQRKSDEPTGQESDKLDALPKSSLDDTDGRQRKPATGWTSSAAVTAPPPPDEVNEDGERTVTIYSSTDHNDLTGIAAAQPGYGTETAATTTEQPWDHKTSAGSGTASTQQVDSAREMLTELVRCLLATSGAPAFIAGYDNDDDEGDDEYGMIDPNGDRDLSYQVRQFFRNSRHGSPSTSSKASPSSDFVGFRPGSVPTPLLVAASPSLRLQRGQVLRDVIRQFELEAIGYDGRAGDNRDAGGGHYREVAKVSAFLEGYRTSEVRRLARETTALLLDKLVQEGVEGLDMTLATMARSSDDYRSDHAGELNDSLLEYLGDTIRQQETKVRTETAALKESPRAPSLSIDDDVDDNLSSLWTVEAGDDGHRVESIDPSDPNVREALHKEFARIRDEKDGNNERSALKSPGEQLLFLLQLLKKRVEAEAAFAPDEKGRNLRLLAYCLRLGSDSEREQLILKGVGNSLDRIDSFMELVASSIEYGESTSHQLQPSRTKPLNVRQLRSIHELCRQIRQRQPR